MQLSTSSEVKNSRTKKSGQNINFPIYRFTLFLDISSFACSKKKKRKTQLKLGTIRYQLFRLSSRHRFQEYHIFRSRDCLNSIPLTDMLQIYVLHFFWPITLLTRPILDQVFKIHTNLICSDPKSFNWNSNVPGSASFFEFFLNVLNSQIRTLA